MGGGPPGTLAIDDVVAIGGGAAVNRPTWSASKRSERSRESKRASDEMPGGDIVDAPPGVTEDWGVDGVVKGKPGATPRPREGPHGSVENGFSIKWPPAHRIWANKKNTCTDEKNTTLGGA